MSEELSFQEGTEHHELIVENQNQRREWGAVADSVIGIFMLSNVLCSLNSEEIEAQCDHGPFTG